MTPEEKRAKWGEGPWVDEDDHVLFEHAGLPCIIHRQQLGHWCGYVAVPPGHPSHGKHYDDVGVIVHGGLTYGDKCRGEICHVAKPGEPDDVFWFGFDCAHSEDLSPAMQKYGHTSDIYRDQEWVTAWTKRLAEQLAAVNAS